MAVPDAVTVRAEDGRRVEATDISPFISNLPFGMPACQPSLPASCVQLLESHTAYLAGYTQRVLNACMRCSMHRSETEEAAGMRIARGGSED